MTAAFHPMKVAFFLLALFGVNGNVQAGDDFALRPQIGIGSLDGKSYRHAGARVLLHANGNQKYGLELSRLNTPLGDYLALGIVLEQRKFGGFNMSIGSIGYFGREGAQNLPGLVSNLGWEPDTRDAFKPFVTLRNDVLFGSTTRVGYALSAGFLLVF